MFTSLVLGTALVSPAAPVPADSVTNASSPAPRIAYLKADVNGNVFITGFTYQKQKQIQTKIEIVNGQQVVKQEPVDVMSQVYFQRQLTDAFIKLTTADGMELAPADAIARVKSGAPVLISSDGKPVEKSWLRAVASDTVVVTSPAMADATFVPQGQGYPAGTAPRLVLLAADADGKVMIAHNPNGNGNFANGYADEQVMFANRGGGVMVMNGRMIQRGGFDVGAPGVQAGQTNFPGKLLDEVKFDAFDLKGAAVPRSEAIKRLKAGGVVLISCDGRLPDADYLKPFQGDLLVLVSSELILPPGAKLSSASVPVKLGVAAPAVQVAPLPAVAPAAIKPVLIAPAQVVRPVGGLRAVPVPVPAQEEKPAEVIPPPKKN